MRGRAQRHVAASRPSHTADSTRRGDGRGENEGTQQATVDVSTQSLEVRIFTGVKFLVAMTAIRVAARVAVRFL